MELQAVIQNYINGTANQNERNALINLLLNLLPAQMTETDVSMDIPVRSLQLREEYRQKLADALFSLYTKVTRSKEKARQRILSFVRYLLDHHKIELILDESLTKENMSALERQVDLLKTLQKGMTKGQLLDHYVVTRKVIEGDLDKLIMGTKILGQHVKIRNYQRQKGELTYQSTVHPIFLPLNLTEVYFLFTGLKSLAQGREDSIAAERYDHLANRIYSQLSDYARERIERRAREDDMDLPPEKEFQKYNESIDEEVMAKGSKKDALMYLFKSGEKCTIHLSNAAREIIHNCYVRLAGESLNIVRIYSAPGKAPIREITQDEIHKIEFEYR